jgi:hypothetical protein
MFKVIIPGYTENYIELAKQNKELLIVKVDGSYRYH